jgi:WD40 repeat protein/transcriptional regulator with XRE-family HTH domain
MPISIPSSTLEKFTTFGDLLRFLRRRVGLTQMELADAVGYSDTQISRLEQNLRLPDISAIEVHFISALGLEDEPKVAARLLDLASNVRREDAPARGLCPYKGLNYFDEADADLFVGRETLTTTLVERIFSLFSNDPQHEKRFLAIVGASGSGKSSLVRAGVVSALRWNKTSADWHIHVLTPTAHPLKSLAASLAHEGRSVSTAGIFIEDLIRDPHGLHHFAALVLHSENRPRLVLVVDQFEELFALCRSEEERALFIGNLLMASYEPNGPTAVVITLRADFYAHCARYAQLRDALAKQQEYIGAMNDVELRRAIEEPAQRGRWEFEPGLIDLLLHDVGHEPGALPLLSHALLETWQRRRGRTMTMSGYASSGGVRGAIAETAETVFTDQFTHEQQAIARRIFLRLTELSYELSAADTRRRAKFNELILRPEEATNTHVVLKALADARLITTNEDSVEVAHEALIREWPTLRGWLDDNREELRLQRHLTEAAEEWYTMNRETDLLYRGARLAQAREWAESHADEMNALEREFLNASIEFSVREVAEREAQHQRELEAAQKLVVSESQRAEEETRSANRLRLRNRAIITVGTIALILAVVAGAFGLRSNQNAIAAETNARIAFARELAAASLSNLEVDPERSILLALHGVRVTAPDKLALPEVENALHRAIASSRIRKTFVAHQGEIWAIAYSPDGTLLATSGSDKNIQIWDAATYKNLLAYKAQDAGAKSITFSVDGKQLAIASDDGAARVLDIETGEILFELRGHTKAVHAITFSPDGKQLATSSLDKSIRFWDAATGKELATWRDIQDPSNQLIYSPDGARILFVDAPVLFAQPGLLHVVEAGSGEEIYRAPVGYYGFALSPDGKRLALIPPDMRFIRILDASNGQPLYNLPRPPNRITWMAFSPDSSRLAVGGYDRKVHLWDTGTGIKLFTLSGHSELVGVVTFSPDGMHLASGAFDGTLKIWSIEPPSEVFTIKQSGFANRLAVSPDGALIAATGSSPSTGSGDFLTVWDAQSGIIIYERKAHAEFAVAVAFSPDGKEIATGGRDHTIKVWDTASGALRHSLYVEDEQIWSIAYHPEGRMFAAVGSAGMIRLYDRATGNAHSSQDAGMGALTGLAFSPDGSRLAIVSLDVNYATIVDVETGEKLFTLIGHTNTNWGVSFSPDGKQVVTCGGDGTARIWDSATGKLVLTLAGHTGVIVTAHFSPDGTRIATASKDGTHRVWDLATGKELLSLESVFSPNDSAFTRDGKRLVISGTGMQVIALTIDELVQIAHSRLTRSLTTGECQQYLHMKQCPAQP